MTLSTYHNEKGKICVPLSTDLQQNKKVVEELFKDGSDFIKREFPVGMHGEVKVLLCYIDLMIDRRLIDQQIVQPLLQFSRMAPPTPEQMKKSIYSWLINGSITTNDIREVEDMDSAILAILSGDSALFIDGYDKVVVVATRGWPNRGIQTADTEVVVRGSKESFNEAIRLNTMLIRRRIRDTRLKFKPMSIGRRSRTDVALGYIEGIAKTELIEDIQTRLEAIDIDGILEGGYIEQLIEDNYVTPFPQFQTTQRPDKVAAALLEGKVCIIVDNTPFVLIVPVTLNSFFQASEDYYERWMIVSFIRIVRYIAAVVSFALPGFYVAVTNFNPSAIPMELAFHMAATRDGVPFPAVIEIFVLELIFEVLKEAGIRLPGPISSTIGIVGGLVIGQSAVGAGLISPMVLIIVGITAISSFTIPNYSITVAFRLLKFAIIILAGMVGIYGWLFGILIAIIHLTGLKSFGHPYLAPFVNSELTDGEEFKDSIIRAPLFMLIKRPFTASDRNRVRLRYNAEKARNKNLDSRRGK